MKFQKSSLGLSKEHSAGLSYKVNFAAVKYKNLGLNAYSSFVSKINVGIYWYTFTKNMLSK